MKESFLMETGMKEMSKSFLLGGVMHTKRDYTISRFLSPEMGCSPSPLPARTSERVRDNEETNSDVIE